MKFLLLITILLIGCTSITSQNPGGFDAECEKYISGTVPLTYSKELYRVINSPNVTILDAREEKEYEVSHLPKSQYIGFYNFDSKSVSLIKKTDTIYIYCSIGFRSEKIGERIQKMGFNNVFNIYGGIFNWVNSGYEVVDKNNKQTKEVHGYNKEWSKLLNEKRCVINLSN
ncbi:rhodanese-like domain-containing protein [Flavobacteriales bacterium]|nr:rhodanese-like domain-containing protein [Flavobacteriales bacterium]